MAQIIPVFNSSQALITPGYPMVACEKASPHAAAEQTAAIAGKSVAAVRNAVLIASGHTSDRVA